MSARKDWLDVAARVSAAVGSQVLIGVRPKGTWFAHCDGVEVDAEAADRAVFALTSMLRSREEAAERTARSDADRADRRLKVLHDVLAGRSGEPTKEQQ